MVLQAFGFFFKMIGSFIGMFFDVELDLGISIGGLILFVFFISFAIGTIYSMARNEYDSYGSYDRFDRVKTARDMQKKTRDLKLGKHVYHKNKH